MHLFLYLVDGEYGFLDLVLSLVNHFRFLNHAAPSSLMTGTLMNHACNRVCSVLRYLSVTTVTLFPIHNLYMIVKVLSYVKV